MAAVCDRGSGASLWFLVALTALTTARSLVHVLAPDGGAGSPPPGAYGNLVVVPLVAIALWFALPRSDDVGAGTWLRSRYARRRGAAAAHPSAYRDTDLRHVFAKLDVPKRVALAALVHRSTE